MRSESIPETMHAGLRPGLRTLFPRFMKSLPSIALAGLLVLPLAGSTEDIPWSREYGWVEFGGAVIPDLDARLGVTGDTGTVNSDLELQLSPGFSVNGGLGERLSDWLAVEIQGGFLYHNVDEVSAADGSFRSLDASLMQVRYSSTSSSNCL